MSVIELVRDIWMNNACVKFEERSLNPSKVIALTTKLCGGRRRCGGGGCVAVENMISPKTYVSREYNDPSVSYVELYWCYCSGSQGEYQETTPEFIG